MQTSLIKTRRNDWGTKAWQKADKNTFKTTTGSVLKKKIKLNQIDVILSVFLTAFCQALVQISVL